MAEKYKDKPFHIVFANPWKWMAGVAEGIVPKLKHAGISDTCPNFTVMAEMTHPDVDVTKLREHKDAREKKEGIRLLAHDILIDLRGKIVYQGALTEEEVDPWVEKLLKDGPPVHINPGPTPTKHFSDVAGMLRNRKDLALAARKLEDYLSGADGPEEKTKEAQRLYECLERYVDRKEASAREALRKDPSVAEARLKETLREFKGSALEKKLEPKAKDLLASDLFKASKELLGVRGAILKTKPCENSAKWSSTYAALNCKECREMQPEALAAIRKSLERILASYPALEFAADLRETLKQLP